VKPSPSPLLAVVALLLLTAVEPLRVGKVTIRALDVYSHDEAGKGRLYRAADRLHVETRPAVIEQFLLFKEGDVFSPERLAETERNLRKLRFLKSASVVASEPHDGVVDVTITTQDAWSIAPETQGGSKGGVSTYGLQLSDTNVLGSGKEVEIGWSKEVDRTRLALGFDDPIFFAPYWHAKAMFGSNSDGYDHRLSVVRPFYAFATPWATEMSYTGFRRDDRLYRDGIEWQRFDQKHKELVASYGIALAPADNHALRLVGGIHTIDDDYSHATGFSTEPLPKSRSFRYFFLRMEQAQNDFVKLNWVNKDLRFEDFNLGRQSSLELAVSPAKFGAQETTEFARATFTDGHRVGGGYVIPSLAASTRFSSGIENAVFTPAVQFVKRTDSETPRALVGRLQLAAGWRLDRDTQFFADGLTGMRGYRSHTFAGDRAIVANLEERIYLGREVLQLASPGVVAFIDAGNATDGGFTQLMKLKTDIGLGIRVGLPRTPKNLLRLDFAWALNRDPLGRRGWLISFASGQAF